MYSTDPADWASHNREEAVNYILSKLAQKEYKSSYDNEIFNRLKFDLTNKCYKHKIDNVHENKTRISDLILQELLFNDYTLLLN